MQQEGPGTGKTEGTPRRGNGGAPGASGQDREARAQQHTGREKRTDKENKVGKKWAKKKRSNAEQKGRQSQKKVGKSKSNRGKDGECEELGQNTEQGNASGCPEWAPGPRGVRTEQTSERPKQAR